MTGRPSMLMHGLGRVVPIALTALAIALIAWSDTADHLWRSAFMLLPLVVLVALICRWTPCRPATRHMLWLVLLLSPFVGAVLPDAPWGLSMPQTQGELPGDITDASSSDAANEVVESAPNDSFTELPVQPICDTPIESPSDDLPFIVTAPTQEDSFIPSEFSNTSFEEAEHPDAVSTVHEFELPSAASPASNEIAEVLPSFTDPTPPLTVARTNPRMPTPLYAASELVGQLSPLVKRIRQDFADWCEQLQLQYAKVQQASIEPMNVAADVEVIASVTPTNQVDSTDQRPAAPVHNEQSIQAPAAGATPTPLVAIRDRSLQWFANWGRSLAAMRDQIMRLPPMPTAIWLAGIILILLMRRRRASALHRLIASGCPATPDLAKLVQETSRQVGLTRPPTVVVVQDRISPMIWFDRAVCLVIPAPLWQELDDEGRRAVIFHELAHLRRRDHWVCRIETLIGAIYWWHPLVWWIRSRLREEAENCCDAWVTWLQPGGRRAYAEALIKTKQFLLDAPAPAPAGAIGISSGPARRFARRLTMVMTQQTSPTGSKRTFVLALSILAIGWAAAPARSCDPPDAKAKEAPRQVYVIETTTPTVAPAPCVTAAPGAPVPTIAPAAVVTPVAGTIVETAPLAQLASFEEPSTRSRSGSDDLAARVERLERQIERLTAALEGRAQVQGGAGGGRGTPRPPSPPAVRPRTPMGQGGSDAAVAAPRGGNREYSMTYAIPKGRKEALLKLMVLPDVPPLVRDAGNGIELIGTAEQHSAFSMFVAMISSDGETQKPYRLPENKLELLTELMIRQDVPVLVSPGDNAITVHGNAATQQAFEAFINLIHPSGASHSNAGMPAEDAQHFERLRSRELNRAGDVAVEAQARELARREHEHAHAVYSRSLAEMEHARKEAVQAEMEAAQGGGGQGTSEAAHLRAASRTLREQAQELETQADRLSDEADALSDRASELSESDGGDSAAEVRELEKRSRELEKAARKLYEKAGKLEAKSEKLESKAEKLEAEIEAAAEKATR